MIDKIGEVVDAIYSLAKESKEAQRRNKNKYDQYRIIYNELLSDALEIIGKKTMILGELENENLDIRFIRNDRRIPGRLGIRYAFISDIQPGKLYREIPKLSQNGFETKFDTCYVNRNNQVLRRVASVERFPKETLYFYQDDGTKEVSFNYHDSSTIVGVSKATFSRENNILEIKEIENSYGSLRKEFPNDRMPICDCVIRIDKYLFMDSRLKECSFNYCQPLFTMFPHISNDPEKIKLEIYESEIQIDRDEEFLPVEYTNEWTLNDYRMIECKEKHRITQKQHEAITKFEQKLYI